MSDAPKPQHKLSFQFRTKCHLNPPLTVEEAATLQEQGKIDGSCDAIFVLCLTYPNEGGIQGTGFGVDGRVGRRAVSGEIEPSPLKDEDKFRAWALLTNELAESVSLGEHQKGLIDATMLNIEAYIQALAELARAVQAQAQARAEM